MYQRDIVASEIYDRPRSSKVTP